MPSSSKHTPLNLVRFALCSFFWLCLIGQVCTRSILTSFHHKNFFTSEMTSNNTCVPVYPFTVTSLCKNKGGKLYLAPNVMHTDAPEHKTRMNVSAKFKRENH